MANRMMRFRESSGDIQHYQWDFPDNMTEQKYEFTMSDFDKYDQWVHLVGMHMSYFAYACKTEGKNGISRLISETALSELLPSRLISATV